MEMDNLGPHSKPIEIFKSWMAFAQAEKRIKEPTAMAVATVSPSGDLRSRVVLCKEWSEAGFTFYTNYNSQKGRDLQHHPKTGVVFYWDPLFRQIHISGSVEKTPRAQSEAYWNSRAREKQLNQYISHQSQPIESREALEKCVAAAEAQFKDRAIPCPEHWGGYLIKPDRFEFWVGQTMRLHDRFVFEKEGANWTFSRLSP